jgi:hypothetical protein
MKKYLFFYALIFCGASQSFSQGGGGELYFRVISNNPSRRIDVTISTNDYSWYYNDAMAKTVVADSFYSHHVDQSWIAYTNAHSSNTLETIPWGLFNIEMIIKEYSGGPSMATRHFVLDLRDEKWAHFGNGYAGVDTFIEYDESTGNFYFTANQNGYYRRELILESSLCQIWKIWNVTYPLLESFEVPVTFKNIAEGYSSDFGYLVAGGNNVNSGDNAPFPYSLTGTVAAGSTNTTIGNLRKVNFVWSKSDDISDVGVKNVYQNSFDFVANSIRSDKTITRIFRTAWPITIRNCLVEASGISADEIYFKDPTSDNQFHLQSATEAGFQSSDVIDSLSIRLGGLYSQKYSVKSKGSFNHSGTNYFWIGGDFNPTTQNDLLISGPTTLTANYKGSLLSNTSTALSHSSQRKMVRGSDGAFYLVYESMEKIWAEYSTDGTTWHLANNGQAIGTGSTPSATSCGNGIYVVYNNGAGFSLYLVTQYETTNYCNSDNDDYGDVNTPVVSISEFSDFIVLWSNSTGIHYNIGNSVTNGPNNIDMDWFVENATLTGTGNSSYTPTVECKNNVFQVAWQQASGSSSYIDYRPLTRQSDGTYIQGSTSVMSSGYPQNYNPSLIAVSRGPWLCWIGDDPDDSQPVTIFHDQAYSGYWYFGFGVTSVSINQSPDRYVIGWANEDGSHEYTDHCHLGNPQPLSSNGSYLQIVNSSSGSTMRSLGFNTGSTPYRFNLSSTIPLYKSAGSSIGKGRGGFVKLGGAQFVFLLGDIIAGNEKIDFVDMSDTVQIDGVSSLNNILETKPFTINGSSPLSYGVAYWTANSAMAVAALQGGKNVSFKVEMVDAETGGVIGLFDQCTYTASQIENHKNIGYDVNTNGIGTRSVKLRLRVAASSDAEYAVVNAVAKDFALKKAGSKNTKINLMNASVVTAYSLSANYPNPFNPSTQIAYQLKDAGVVRLGVYDMLGREVAVLVNERQESGFYSATWNAGNHLSSGSYIYRISVKDENGKSRFSETKRMMLIK